MRLRAAALAALLILTSACAPLAGQSGVRVSPSAAPHSPWAFEESDIPVDPAYRFGRLANGMRYILRSNALPKGTALVRMEVAAGSLNERPEELGFAHFVEHMAFNGSTNVPEGEMLRLLQRSGLSFGADTNASTGFRQTTYMLDLPRNDAGLLDTALMLMRETASELTFAPDAVDRERGVLLAELRDRNSWQFRNAVDEARFFHPEALYPRRFPIGTVGTLSAATPQTLKAFWRREYVPAQTTLIVIGDMDADLVEAQIRARFADWQPSPPERQPDGGPVLTRDRARTAIYIDPPVAERVVAARHGRWLDEPDSVASRRENLLRQIGYAIVNRRLLRIARQPQPPFRGAGFGTGDVFEVGRTTRLIVDTVDGGWRQGVTAAAIEYRRALQFGFTEAEVAEQIAIVRAQAENAAASAETRSNGALANSAFALIRDRVVPSDPRDAQARLEAFIPEITPDRVHGALLREAVAIEKPLIRFQGRREPAGGATAIRAAWQAAMKAPLERDVQPAATGFAYENFGVPGRVIADDIGPLGIRQLRFANGVMLNLKRTDIERGRILVKVGVDGGDRLDTRTNPLATEMFSSLPEGGLGKHTQDELDTILAGRTVGKSIAAASDRFVATGRTTPQDLGLQLSLFAAYLSDPGYRPEGETRYRLNINNYFARKDATPHSAMQAAIGGILSDNDPRFTLHPPEDYRRLTFAGLRQAVSDRLARGAVEIGIVGDFDEEQAIAEVARSFGAFPLRETVFQSDERELPRPFTDTRGLRVIRHRGASDQALLRLTWPTRDDSDPVETLQLELLEKILRVEMTETLREKLGKTYSPSAMSAPSRNWAGYGTFSIMASVDVREVPATRSAISDSLRRLRAAPVDADLFQRARQPMLEAFDNGLKSNSGWLTLVDRAQSEAERIDRYRQGKARLQATTPADIQALVVRYLDPEQAVEVLALPEGVALPGAE